MGYLDRLGAIEYQIKKNLGYTPSEQQLVAMTQSILTAVLRAAESAPVPEDLYGAVQGGTLPTTFLGVTVDWDLTNPEGDSFTLTLSGTTVTQDADDPMQEISSGGGGTEFITTWQTDATGTTTSNPDQVKLPLNSAGTYNFTVDWGDGTTNTITSFDQAEATHTYSAVGSYDITIDGVCEGWGFAWSGEDDSKLTGIKQWGNVKLHNNGYQFYQCTNLSSYTATDNPDLTNVTNMSAMFYYAILPAGFDISGWNTSSVTNMGYMFSSATLPDTFNLSGWCVSNIATEPAGFGTFNGTTQLKPVWGTCP